MKISKEQLKKIIMKEVRALRESSADALSQDVGMHVNTLTDEIADVWIDEYDEDDPVMAEYGADAWVEQCQNAVLALNDEIRTLVDKIHNDLHDGQFAN